MMKQILYAVLVLVLCCSAMNVTFVSHAEPVTSKTTAASADLAWTTTAWTGDDTPYAKIRADVDSLIATGKLTPALVASYENDWKQHPSDAHVVFRFAYAFYSGQQLHPPINPKGSMPDTVFEGAPSQATYNYIRIRFLSNAEYFAQPQFIGVGQRLLKQKPDDHDVEYYLIDCYKPWQSTADKQAALYYSNDLVRRDPNKRAGYGSLAHVYFETWMVKRDRPDALQAIADYQKYLQLGPPTALARKQVAYIIS